MRKFDKVVAIGAAAVTGPLLAYGAISVRDYLAAEPAHDEHFDLEGVFVSSSPGGDPTHSCFDEDPCYIYGPGGSGGGGGGGGGGWSGGGGGDCSNDPNHCDEDVPPIPEECQTDAQIVSEAQNFLINNSQTARDLINTIRNQGTSVELMNFDVTGNPGSYSPESNIIRWDPFLAAQGHNLDGSMYTIFPIMILAHEIVHASERNNVLGANENYVMLTTNAIARELNSSASLGYDINRDNHDAERTFYVSSTNASNVAGDYVGNRPHCTK